MLDIRENELEQRQMEMAKILTTLRKQEQELQEILDSQVKNSQEMEALYNFDALDIQQIENHRVYGLKLISDQANKERIIANTRNLIKLKQKEVNEAYKKVEVLKKLKQNLKQKRRDARFGGGILNARGIKSLYKRHYFLSAVIFIRAVIFTNAVISGENNV